MSATQPLALPPRRPSTVHRLPTRGLSSKLKSCTNESPVRSPTSKPSPRNPTPLLRLLFSTGCPPRRRASPSHRQSVSTHIKLSTSPHDADKPSVPRNGSSPRSDSNPPRGSSIAPPSTPREMSQTDRIRALCDTLERAASVLRDEQLVPRRAAFSHLVVLMMEEELKGLERVLHMVEEARGVKEEEVGGREVGEVGRQEEVMKREDARATEEPDADDIEDFSDDLSLSDDDDISSSSHFPAVVPLIGVKSQDHFPAQPIGVLDKKKHPPESTTTSADVYPDVLPTVEPESDIETLQVPPSPPASLSPDPPIELAPIRSQRSQRRVRGIDNDEQPVLEGVEKPSSSRPRSRSHSRRRRSPTPDSSCESDTSQTRSSRGKSSSKRSDDAQRALAMASAPPLEAPPPTLIVPIAFDNPLIISHLAHTLLHSLSYSSLSSLSLLSTSFHALLTPILYSHLTLSSLHTTELLSRTFSTTPSLASHVLSLSLSPSDPIDSYLTLTSYILKLTRNLQTLTEDLTSLEWDISSFTSDYPLPLSSPSLKHLSSARCWWEIGAIHSLIVSSPLLSTLKIGGSVVDREWEGSSLLLSSTPSSIGREMRRLEVESVMHADTLRVLLKVCCPRIEVLKIGISSVGDTDDDVPLSSIPGALGYVSGTLRSLSMKGPRKGDGECWGLLEGCLRVLRVLEVLEFEEVGGKAMAGSKVLECLPMSLKVLRGRGIGESSFSLISRVRTDGRLM